MALVLMSVVGRACLSNLLKKRVCRFFMIKLLLNILHTPCQCFGLLSCEDYWDRPLMALCFGV
jgi:hypothetical protein